MDEMINELIEKQAQIAISDSQYKRESLEELREIKKELQNIRVILESKYVSSRRVERIRNEDGSVTRILHDLEDPLEELRKQYHIDQ